MDHSVGMEGTKTSGLSYDLMRRERLYLHAQSHLRRKKTILPRDIRHCYPLDLNVIYKKKEKKI